MLPPKERFRKQMNAAYRRKLGLALLAVAGCAILAVGLDIQGPVRWVVVLAAVGLLPGAAVAPFLGLSDVSHYLAVTVVISLAVATLAAMLQVALGWWQPVLVGLVVTGASCVSIAYDLVHNLRSNQEVSV
jgi:hypothetical protein